MLKEARQYSLKAIQDEVLALVARGAVGRQHLIYAIARYFSDFEWAEMKHSLESNEYLLRDYVCDLIGHESWAND